MKKTLLTLLLLTLWSMCSFAQSFSLVADTNVGMDSSHPRYLTEYNGKIYFVATNGTHAKLYASDGTTAGTTLVGPTPGNGVVWYLTKYNGKLYFTYDDGIHGLELWTSDGTSAGTFLLKDIWTGNTAGGIPYSSLPRYFTVCNGLLFFQAGTATRSQGLWVTDGTAAGTQMLGNQYSDPFASNDSFIVLNNKIYFEGNAGSGYGMWSSDGTTAGTVQVKPGIIGSPSINHAILNNKIYFQSDDAINGGELWVSDGTNTGTVMVKNINTVSYSSDPQNFFTDGQKVYFSANDGITGRELWCTDGTNAGTQLVKDSNVGSGNSALYSSNPNGMIFYHNTVYYFGYNGTSVEMSTTNGTLAGTNIIKTLPNIIGVSYSYVFNDKIYFVGFASAGGSEYLYESDGTTNGTFQISPIVNTYSSSPNGFNFQEFNGELFLPAYIGNRGNEFCKLTPALNNSEWNATNSLHISPNPVQENLELRIPETLLGAIGQIRNIQGQKLFSFTTKSVIENIPMENMPKGFYLVTLEKEGKFFQKKILKN